MISKYDKECVKCKILSLSLTKIGEELDINNDNSSKNKFSDLEILKRLEEKLEEDK